MWDQSWWVKPSQEIWRGQVGEKAWSVRFDGDDGRLWTLTVSLLGGSDSRSTRLGWEPRQGRFSSALPMWLSQVEQPLGEALSRRSAGIPALEPEQRGLLDALAVNLDKPGPTSGKRLRAQLELKRDPFSHLVASLSPRHVRELHESYELTLPGLLACGKSAEVTRVLDTVLALLRARFREDPDFNVYTWDELKAASGMPNGSMHLVDKILAAAQLLNGGGGSCNDDPTSMWIYRWGTPVDIEEVVECADLSAFIAYIRQGGSGRPWPTAPVLLPEELERLRRTSPFLSAEPEEGEEPPSAVPPGAPHDRIDEVPEDTVAAPEPLVENDIEPKMKTDEREVLELIWTERKTQGDWPHKKQLWKQLRALGKDIEEFAAQAPWMRVGERVRVGLETLLVLPEVRELLAPLPGFLRLLARRFIEQPNLEQETNSTGPEVKASEFFDLWGDEPRARLALKLISEFLPWPIQLRGTSSGEFYFRPDLQSLEYEHVETLEQVLEASRPWARGSVKHEPRGFHLELLQTVYRSIREKGHWPSLAEFTLEHRAQLGYIPKLVDELSPTFIQKQDDYERPPRIRLTADALPYVAGDTGCALAATIVRTLMELLSDAESEQHTFSIDQLSTRLKLPVERVRPVAMLLESERWASVERWRQQDEGWSIRVHEHALWEYRDVRTWKQYIEIRDRYSTEKLLASLGTRVPLDPVEQAVQVLSSQKSRAQNRPGAKPARSGTKVFIGHGHSATWMYLRDFLRDKLHLEPVEFNSTPAAGQHTIARLQQLLDECDLAFLVMTAEDVRADGSLHARLNVVHEIGLFQGRHGFERAIILIEKGCSEFSNIAGLGYISFPPGEIRACFEEIRDTLGKLLPSRG